MFVATGYGIQNISTLNFTFIDAPYYQLGNLNNKTKVNDLAILDNVLYAATASGVAYANLINTNLNNPASWTSYNLSPLNADVQAIEAFDNKVFAGSITGFQYFNGNNWLPYPLSGVSDTNIISIKSISNKLYFINSRIIYYAEAGNLQNITQFQNPGNYNVISVDNNLNPAIGSSDNGSLLKIGSNYEYLFPNGPYRSSFEYLYVDNNGNLWAAGGLGDAGFYMFDGKTWVNYNTSSHPQIGNSNFFRSVHYGQGTLWALSWGGGVTYINGSTIKNINPSNSVLPGISENPNFCVPSGCAYDNNGYLWTSFYRTNTSRSLYVFTGNDSLWTGFINPSVISSSFLENIAIDNYNTISNTSDDIYGFYNLNDFSVDDLTDVIVDRNNEVWVSTNNGVFIISNPLAAIQNPNQKPVPQKLRIISGNLAVPFTENCRTLRNDILNEKWIGTDNNGVFHLSEDGSTLIETFNTLNSPILDNSITSIVISNKSGKAYFGTLKGLSSYQTNAIEPLEEFDEIVCSPNPYLLPPNVDLRIDGLIEDSFIKIMTLSGEIITEFESPGGKIATWNGRNFNDELVPSGIYIVIAFNKDGSKVGKGKIAIVRR
jgi:ligand-binding sensor domain-containing protein